MLPLLFKGLAIGLAIAAPVGPIGLLCIRRGLSDGRLAAFVTGLGAAAADGVYGAIGAFGVTAIGEFLSAQGLWLGLFGGLFLCWLGIAAIRRPPTKAAAATPPRARDLLSFFASTFLLTLSNPATILSFAAVFAGLGLAGAEGYGAAIWLILGVFLGSAAWWLFLANAVGWLGKRLDAGAMVWINRFSGAILLGFGLWAIYRALAPLF